MNYLVIGGSKSGKSKISEDIALVLNKDKVIYIATMKPFDKEDELRIKKHIARRENFNFITIEKQKDICEIIDEIHESDTVLMDSITSLLTNEMFDKNIINDNPAPKIITELQLIMNKAENTVIVSDYIFSDGIIYDDITENYKRQLAIVNKELTKVCDNVLECTYGNVKYHKIR